MGNNSSTYVDEDIMNILKNKNPKSYFYPLTGKQSNNLFILYDKVLCKVVKSLEKNNDFIILRRRAKIIHLHSIGYSKGEIIAFLFDKGTKPFIIFEYNNPNFNKSIKLLKDSLNKKYEEVESKPLIDNNFIITTLYIPDELSCREYFWATDVFVEQI